MAPRKKNASIKSSGATSSKAAPLPDWVKGGAPKPAPSHTRAAAAAAQEESTSTSSRSNSNSNSNSNSSSSRPPPLFPPGVKPPISLLNERIQKHHASAGWQRANIEVRRARGMMREQPGGPREYWLALEAYKKHAPAHLDWMWASEPFEAAAKRIAERSAKEAQRQREAQAREKGEVLQPDGRSKLGKAWTEAREVRMSARLREMTEKTVRAALNLFPQAAITPLADEERQEEDAQVRASDGKGVARGAMDEAAVESLIKQLTALGFRVGHARSAARWVHTTRAGLRTASSSSSSSSSPSVPSAEASLRSSIVSLGDREAALEYLVLFTPEEDLPLSFAPSKKADAFITDSTAGEEKERLAVRWAMDRLVRYAGFPRKAVQRAMAQTHEAHIEVDKREIVVLDMLLARLVGDEEEAKRVLLAASDEGAGRTSQEKQEGKRKRLDEKLTVGAVLGEEKLRGIPQDERPLSSSSDSEDVAAAASTNYDVVVAQRKKGKGSAEGEEVILRVCPGEKSRYPTMASLSAADKGISSSTSASLPTFYVASSTLPAYLRLALTARLIRATRTRPDWIEMLSAGEGGLILLMVEELENTWKEVCEDPPDLASVMHGLVPAPSVSTSGDASLDVAASNSVIDSRAVSGKALQRVKALRRDAQMDTRLLQVAQSLSPAEQKTCAQMRKVREALPAFKARDKVLQLLNSNRVIIVAGETGCGKTTQIPQYILDDFVQRKEGSLCSVVVTQPRRVSAMGVAARVAEERAERLGSGVVGYAIRGERKASKDCRLLFSTTGVLLRRLATGDPDLVGLSHVIVDEVHERSVDSDFLLLELRRVLQRNPTLRVILMSATIDQQVFSDYFAGAPCVGIPGRTFPVSDHHLEDLIRLTHYRPSARNVGATKHKTEKQVEGIRNSLMQCDLAENDLQSVLSIVASQRIDYELLACAVKMLCERAEAEEREGGADHSAGGAILIFLPGVGEIRQAIEAIRSAIRTNVDIMPLHANLSSEEQHRVFLPSSSKGLRKIVVSTNVAETSITIPEISYVIDSGRVKETRFEPESGLTRLVDCWASRAACRQRRGRAGRTRAGECWKLFSKYTEERQMSAQQTPEIRRVPLESLFLQAKAMDEETDVKDYLGQAIDPPNVGSMDQALSTLIEVGAIQQDRGFKSRLTALGRHLSNLPLDLRLGKLLILGSVFQALAPMLTVAAIMSCKPLFLAPFEKREEANAARFRFATANSDLLTDVNAYDAWARLRSERASNAEMRDFCEQNFISPSSLRDIQSVRMDLLSQLQQLGFVPRTYDARAYLRDDGSLHALDQHASNHSLLSSLILAALYPSVIRVSLPSAKFDQGSSGAIQRAAEAKALKYFDATGRVFLHPSSILFSSNHIQGHLVCFKKSASGEGQSSKTYLRDATDVPLFALLLFGGKLTIHHLAGGISIGSHALKQEGAANGSDSSARPTQEIRLRANARIGVLCGQLRRLLDAVMAEAFESPADDGIATADKTGVIETMRALLARDGLEPI
ncbi:atp-dependent rna helicase a [Ceraceosorus bombacis]|uniref:Atp-dependent rna helicase a n=1 Tax=Ceraceosorus bombacis TaxID=401625 RepID=A0A0P1BNH0_9BASI|nr:atp-dependent rna helicase a [Ceraceosorus bombacis]